MIPTSVLYRICIEVRYSQSKVMLPHTMRKQVKGFGCIAIYPLWRGGDALVFASMFIGKGQTPHISDTEIALISNIVLC